MSGYNKNELRRIVKILKESQENDVYYSRSSTIMQSVETLPVFLEAETVMIYWSIRGEVFTHDFIRRWERRKKIILPSVNGDVMQLKLFKGESNLVEGGLYQIPEPGGPLFSDHEEIDLVVVPGIAFDRQCNRMGRGKAYYDRFLKSVNAFKLGICFSFQLFDSIPTDEHDVKMDMVVTDEPGHLTSERLQ